MYYLPEFGLLGQGEIACSPSEGVGDLPSLPSPPRSLGLPRPPSDLMLVGLPLPRLLLFTLPSYKFKLKKFTKNHTFFCPSVFKKSA